MREKVFLIIILSAFFIGLMAPIVAAEEIEIEDSPGETKEERVERLFFYISQWSREYSELEGPAIRELRSMGVEAVAMLMPHLESKDVRERVMMENLINGVGAECTPYLIEGLSLESTLGRQRCATYLGNVGDERAVWPLEEIATKGDEWNVVEAAINGLGKIATRDIDVPSEPITPFLTHEMEPLRLAAVVALGRIGDEETIPLLIDALNDELFSIRYPAAQALASFGDATVEPLGKLLESPDVRIQSLACYALGLSESDAAYDYLKSALSSPEPIVRAHAVEGFKNLGDSRIRITLLRMKIRETDQGVLGEIEEALGDL